MSRPRYMIGDVTKLAGYCHPFNPDVPFYMGMGVQTPPAGGTFTANGKDYRVVAAFDSEYDLNPFFVDVVMAVRI